MTVVLLHVSGKDKKKEGVKRGAFFLSEEGKVIAWGSNVFNQCDVPTDLPKVIAIACSSYHSLVLTNDGKVIAWGDNRDNQCDVPENLNLFTNNKVIDTFAESIRSRIYNHKYIHNYTHTHIIVYSYICVRINICVCMYCEG